MVKQAVVFPGQGAQRPGMALDFVEQFDVSKQVFDQANQALPFDIVDLIQSEEEKLNLTEYTQPCILTAEMAMFVALKKYFGYQPQYFAGHSLGEYTALVAVGAMPLEVAVKLVHLRGQLMQKAVPAGEGSMAAIINDGLAVDEIRSLCDSFEVDVANDNSPTQVVASGRKEGVDQVIVALEPEVEAGMRVVPLVVSAPFHSRYMAVIEDQFKQALNEVRGELDAPKATKVISNFLGNFHTGDTDDLIDALTRQISGTVRWRDNMKMLIDVADEIVEVGPNRPLRGFFKAMDSNIKAVIDVRSANKAFGTPQEVS